MENAVLTLPLHSSRKLQSFDLSTFVLSFFKYFSVAVDTWIHRNTGTTLSYIRLLNVLVKHIKKSALFHFVLGVVPSETNLNFILK